MNKKSGQQFFFLIGVVLIVLIGYRLVSLNKTQDITQQCVTHTGVGMHIHPHLKIIISGQEVSIPAETGITFGCMRPIHTHDTSGTLHLEFPQTRDVKLAEFFAIWEQSFSSTTLMDAVGPVKMAVNGQPNTLFENYVMRDKDQIILIAE